jgi:hypothetical protein
LVCLHSFVVSLPCDRDRQPLFLSFFVSPLSSEGALAE